MTTQEFDLVLKQGEGFNIEFKRNLNKDITKEICAFVNSAGGKIFIGVNDDNTVHGVKITNNLKSEIYSYLQPVNPLPEIEVSEIKYNNKDILIVECKSGKEKPYVAAGAIYVRTGANSQKLTSPEQMRDFFQENGKIRFEQSVNKNFNYESDFSEQKFQDFLKKIDINNLTEKNILLQNLLLFEPEKGLNNAGILLFAENPQKFFPHSKIRCTLFKGNDKRFIIDDKIIEGSIVEQFFNAIAFLKQKLELRYDIEKSGSYQRIEKLEIPEIVFREALVNAIVHRDYFESGAEISVEIFDDRVEISNPGGLLPGITDKDFGKRSLSRNPLIFGIFHRLKLVEKIGSGIQRMMIAMKDENLPTPHFSTQKFFTVSFSRPVDFNIWLKTLRNNLNDTQLEILKAINRNPNLTYNSLCVILNLGKTTVFNNVKALKEMEIIEHVGSDKSGYWAINFKRFN